MDPVIAYFFVAVPAFSIGTGLGSFAGVLAARMHEIKRKREARVLPLPCARQVWKVEGIGRVLIDGVYSGQVHYFRPSRDPNVDPLDDRGWREAALMMDLEEFDKLATLEYR
jgi:hypothetical protein